MPRRQVEAPAGPHEDSASTLGAPSCLDTGSLQVPPGLAHAGVQGTQPHVAQTPQGASMGMSGTPPTPNHSAELPPVFQALVASCGSSVTPVRACRAAEPAQVKLPQGRSLTLNVCKGAEGAARAVPGLAHVVAFRRFVDLGEK